MGPGPVVVGDVCAKYMLEVPAAKDEHPVQALCSDRWTHRSAKAFARGARIGSC